MILWRPGDVLVRPFRLEVGELSEDDIETSGQKNVGECLEPENAHDGIGQRVRR